MKKHDDLKNEAKKYLVSIGAKGIKEEVTVKVGKRKITVDLVAKLGKESIAVECGGSPSDRIVLLQSHFDRVILFPYNTHVIISDESKEILKLRDEINEMEKQYQEDVKKLENKVSRRDKRISSLQELQTLHNEGQKQENIKKGILIRLLANMHWPAYGPEPTNSLINLVDTLISSPDKTRKILQFMREEDELKEKGWRS